jgi:hypothetical protein
MYLNSIEYVYRIQLNLDCLSGLYVEVKLCNLNLIYEDT